MTLSQRFRPSQLWLDDQGVPINAHGGGIVWHHGRYYWYGEHKIAGTAGNRAHVGVHCYSSSDLFHWKDEGIALAVSDDRSSDIAKGCVLERPKVIYNESDRKFVMWFHLELLSAAASYTSARCGVAVADCPAGPFRFLYSLRPNAGSFPINARGEHHDEASIEAAAAIYGQLSCGENDMTPRYNVLGCDVPGGQQSRDMTLFVDDNGIAYHVYSSEHNSTLHIAQLSADYLTHSPWYARVFEHRWMEAPALFKRQGIYYFIGSGCTGWSPNAARSAIAHNLFGPWREIGNPCRGRNPHNSLDESLTFGAQSTFVLAVHGMEDAYIAMFDEWRPENAIDGRYIWLPIRFVEDRFEIEWHDEWDLSVFTSSTA